MYYKLPVNSAKIFYLCTLVGCIIPSKNSVSQQVDVTLFTH